MWPTKWTQKDKYCFAVRGSNTWIDRIYFPSQIRTYEASLEPFPLVAPSILELKVAEKAYHPGGTRFNDTLITGRDAFGACLRLRFKAIGRRAHPPTLHNMHALLLDKLAEHRAEPRERSVLLRDHIVLQYSTL